MYAWQSHPNNNQRFREGQTVTLNDTWSAFSYLNTEFGHIFPRKIDKVDGDIVEFILGKKTTISFASQVLSGR